MSLYQVCQLKHLGAQSFLADLQALKKRFVDTTDTDPTLIGVFTGLFGMVGYVVHARSGEVVGHTGKPRAGSGGA